MLDHTADFGYYSVMSNAGLFPIAVPPAALPLPVVNALKDIAGIQIGGGLQDPIRFATTGEEAELTANGLRFTDDSFNGGHEWYVWRILLRDFLARVAFRTTTTTVSMQAGEGGVALSAAVRADTTEPVRPAGTVQFYADGAKLGRPARIIAGTAVLPEAQLSAGLHTITATYGGSTYYNPCTSAPIPVTSS